MTTWEEQRDARLEYQDKGPHPYTKREVWNPLPPPLPPPPPDIRSEILEFTGPVRSGLVPEVRFGGMLSMTSGGIWFPNQDPVSYGTQYTLRFRYWGDSIQDRVVPLFDRFEGGSVSHNKFTTQVITVTPSGDFVLLPGDITYRNFNEARKELPLLRRSIPEGAFVLGYLISRGVVTKWENPFQIRAIPTHRFGF